MAAPCAAQGALAATATLVAALREPDSVLLLDVPQWDLLIRTARMARLLGALVAVIPPETRSRLPAAIRRVLDGERRRSDFFANAMRYELECAREVLSRFSIPIVLLKGASYFMQGHAFAVGRDISDVDIMVPRDRLDEAERALLSADWQFTKTDPYDQHYYRAWSHELPSMRVPGHALELDLHHTILPIKGRLRPNSSELFSAARRLPGGEWLVLDRADEVLHAAAHVFQDSDCWNVLRNVHDIDQLIRLYAAQDPSVYFERLLQRADLHQLARPLWYAMSLAREQFATPIPEHVLSFIKPRFSAHLGTSLTLRCMRQVVTPIHPDAMPTRSQRLARRFLLFRAAWLRMPPWLLTYHTARKLARSLRAQEEEGAAP